MTTLAALKDEISSDLDRFDADSVNFIASEINKSIRYYQRVRFYFNETRDETFSTVVDQKLYTSADSAAIQKFIEIDQIVVMKGTQPVELEEISPKEWEVWTASENSKGLPWAYCYFNRSIGLYPIPDDAYMVRMIGHIMKDAPADDDEAGNVWMTEAFDLIRARTCAQLSMKKFIDADRTQVHRAAESDERWRLDTETTSRLATGFLTSTEF